VSEASEQTVPAELSYQEALNELEAIVAQLDQGSIDIDALGTRFQRAIDIVEDLDGRILRTKEQVDQLAPRLEQLRNGNG
jgi:exodeoxyribonuclease VII small subunit